MAAKCLGRGSFRYRERPFAGRPLGAVRIRRHPLRTCVGSGGFCDLGQSIYLASLRHAGPTTTGAQLLHAGAGCRTPDGRLGLRLVRVGDILHLVELPNGFDQTLGPRASRRAVGQVPELCLDLGVGRGPLSVPRAPFTSTSSVRPSLKVTLIRASDTGTPGTTASETLRASAGRRYR